MKDKNLMMSMLKDVEKMMANDTSGDEYVHEAKSYVGCAILLLAASKRKQEEAQRNKVKVHCQSDTASVEPEYSMRKLLQEVQDLEGA